MDPSRQRRAQEARLHGASFLARPGWATGVSGSRAGRQELTTHSPPGVTGDCSGRHQHQGRKLGQAPRALGAAPQAPQAMLPNKPLTALMGSTIPASAPAEPPVSDLHPRQQSAPAPPPAPQANCTLQTPSARQPALLSGCASSKTTLLLV